IEKTLERLRGEKIELRQLATSEGPKAPPKREAKSEDDGFKPKAADIDHLTMLIPTNEIATRVGEDVTPFANYIKAAWRKTDEIVSSAKPEDVTAKGLVVIVGVKAKDKTRVWSEAVDGNIPAELLRRVEKEV